MNDLLLNIIGYSASLCMVLGYLPQAISTIRTNVIASVSSVIIFGIKMHNDRKKRGQ